MNKPRDSDTFDIIVCGAGTAGAGAAYQLARVGKRVALLDRLPFSKAGARWINAVAPWQFERAGIALPKPPETIHEGAPAILESPGIHARVRIDDAALWEVDMRLLARRLQKLALAEKVASFEQTRIDHFEFEDGRPRALHAKDKDGADISLRADLFVDATGIAAVLRGQVPALADSCPAVPKEHTCTAAQYVLEIADKEGALAFLEENDLPTGQTLTRLGVDGGFSTFNVFIDDELTHVSLLTGSIADGSHGTGPEMIQRWREENPWAGKVEFGGAGLIPIRRPYDRLAAPGIALIGNSASQVFPAHGSGIGVGLIAGRIMAETLGRLRDPGSLEATWAYQCAAQRELGTALAVSDIMRRASQRFTPEIVDAMIDGGFITPTTGRAALTQQAAAPSAGELFALARGAFRYLKLLMRLAPAGIKAARVQSLYRAYPDHPDGEALAHWSRRVARIFGEQPDIR